jgi:hypothetical protein
MSLLIFPQSGANHRAKERVEEGARKCEGLIGKSKPEFCSQFPCVFQGLSVMTLLYARIRHDDVFLQEHF